MMNVNASSKKQILADDVEYDIISNLPKDIISHIMSFLPTKDAIRTCVLSKRWELLWMSITGLRIEGVHLSYKQQKKKQCFINFMNRVLQNLSRIHSFTLCLSTLYSRKENQFDHLPAWISSVLILGVQNLCIEYSSNKYYNFSISLFHSISLLQLDLNICCNLIVPSSNCFKNLKTLKLQHIKFIGDVHPEEMVLNFPAVELFDCRFCIWSNVKTFIIKAPLLESFSLVFPKYNCDKPCSLTVKIIAMFLKSFHYSGLLPGDIIFSNPLSVVYACIDICPLVWPLLHYNYNFSGDELRQHVPKACKLLTDFQRVNHLKLGLYTIKLLTHGRDYVSTLPVFQCLVRLELDLSNSLPSQQILPDLLHKSPNIEYLELLSELINVDKDLFMPQCFLSRLKAVIVKFFEWNASSLSLTKYILENIEVLEQLNVMVSKGRKWEILKELQSPNDSCVALVQVAKATIRSLYCYRNSFYEPK